MYIGLLSNRVWPPVCLQQARRLRTSEGVDIPLAHRVADAPRDISVFRPHVRCDAWGLNSGYVVHQISLTRFIW